RLGRDASPEHAGSAEPVALDDGRVHAQLGAPNGTDVTGGSAAEKDDVERRHVFGDLSGRDRASGRVARYEKLTGRSVADATALFRLSCRNAAGLVGSSPCSLRAHGPALYFI